MNKPKATEEGVNDPNAVDPTAHTEHAMQVMPEVDEDGIDEDQRETLPHVSPTDRTLHQSAAVSDPSLLPPARISIAPGPASMNIETRFDEDLEIQIITRPVAYITNERGIATTPPIPFFEGYSINRFRTKKPKEELSPNTTIYTVGSDPRCDIHLSKEDYPLAKPFHAFVKIEDGKTWIIRDEGLVKIAKKPGFAMSWREIDPHKDTIEIIQRSSQEGGRALESAFVRVVPEFQSLEEHDKQSVKDTLRARVTALTDRLNKVSEQFKKLVEKDETSEEKLKQLFEEAEDISALINNLTKLEVDHELVMNPTAVIARTQHLILLTESLGKLLEQMFSISEGYTEIARYRKEEKERRAKELHLGAQRWEVDVLHTLPDEDPLMETREDAEETENESILERKEVLHVFRRPTYTLKKNGEKTSKPIPMLIPALDIGTHTVCHIELDPSSESKPNSKNHIAPFAGKLFYQYEGGERVLYFQYLQPNVLIKGSETSAKKVPPPSETFRVTEGMSIYIGGYELKVDNRTHGFTYGLIKDDVLGTLENPGIVDELFECIDDQSVTSWEQDAQAIRYLQAIMKEVEESNLPEEEKKLFRDKYEKNFEDITQKLIRKIQDGWRSAEPHADSGHFQTLLLFAHAEDGYARTAQYFHAPEGILKYEASRRVDVYTKPHRQKPSKTKKTILGTFNRVLGIFNSRKNKSEKPEKISVNPTAAVEVARFLEFELIDEEDIQGLGAFTARVQKILKVRKHFKKLDNDNTNLTEILELRDLCNNLSMSDIFAAEEIQTRNLHIEVDMKPEGKAKEYVRKICIFQARKAFKRLKESNDPEHIRADEALITGLCAIGIMQKFELIDNVNEFIPQEEIDAIIQQKREENPNATDEELQNELKTKEANDLISEQLTKAEALEQAEKARERLEEDINRAVKHVAIIQHQNMEARDSGMTFELLQQMMPLTKVVFNPGLQKVMDDSTYDLHVGEIKYNSGKAHAKATPTRLNWHRIFKEWTNRFRDGLRRVARKSLSSGQNMEAMYHMVDEALAQGYVEKEAFEGLCVELYRGYKAKQYKQTALSAGITNFDYLQQAPVHAFSTAEDKAFFESVKNRITFAKLQQMIDGLRSGSAQKKFKYMMKLKELQSKDSMATAILERMDLTEQERDLLQ